MTSRKIWRWLQELGSRTLSIESDSPWENGCPGSFNSKLQDELFNRETFFALQAASMLIERWRREYKQVRPHSSHGYRPRAPEAIRFCPMTSLPITTRAFVTAQILAQTGGRLTSVLLRLDRTAGVQKLLRPCTPVSLTG
ncbi:MAG: hypothetical protein A2139_11145 [Desulfobacca sp. RBG_16_60_12]|nr:MAG: hypothetical protein A2139_11145 [Desulfobacca sp. RBG_16_60_12]